MSMVSEKMIEAAKAVIAQWDTPNWKLTEPTAKLIEELRKAVNEAALSTDAEPVKTADIMADVKNFAHWHHLNEWTIKNGRKPSDSEIDFEVEAFRKIERSVKAQPAPFVAVKAGPLAHALASELERMRQPRPNGDILHDALSRVLPALSTDAEPVAWFYEYRDYPKQQDWHKTVSLSRVTESAVNREYIRNVRPLYAAPPAPSVAVKALKWKSYREPGQSARIKAVHPFGEYRIIDNSRDGELWSPELGGVNVTFNGWDEAKAAAQADYETRILSALCAQVQDVAEVSPTDYMRRHDAAIAAYEANTPSDYRYSAAALRKAVDAAFAVAAAPAAKQEGKP